MTLGLKLDNPWLRVAHLIQGLHAIGVMVSQQRRLTPSRLRFLNVTKLREAWEGVKRYGSRAGGVAGSGTEY
jgi:hypothetical protein